MCEVSLANNIRAVAAVADVLCRLRTHQCYWVNERWTSPECSPFIYQHTAFGERQRYTSETNRNGKNKNRLLKIWEVNPAEVKSPQWSMVAASDRADE